MEDVVNYINGKSIALIGNAESLFYHHWRSAIESHDIVWRMNRGVLLNYIQRRNVSTRCEMYSCGGKSGRVEHENYWVTQKPKYRIWCPAWGDGGYDPNKLGMDFTLPTSYREQLTEQMADAHPSTGMITTEYIIQQDVKQLTLFGFDHFETKTYYRQIPKPVGAHSPEQEKAYFQRLVDTDSRVQFGLDRFPKTGLAV